MFGNNHLYNCPYLKTPEVEALVMTKEGILWVAVVGTTTDTQTSSRDCTVERRMEWETLEGL